MPVVSTEVRDLIVRVVSYVLKRPSASRGFQYAKASAALVVCILISRSQDLPEFDIFSKSLLSIGSNGK